MIVHYCASRIQRLVHRINSLSAIILNLVPECLKISSLSVWNLSAKTSDWARSRLGWSSIEAEFIYFEFL